MSGAEPERPASGPEPDMSGAGPEGPASGPGPDMSGAEPEGPGVRPRVGYVRCGAGKAGCPGQSRICPVRSRKGRRPGRSRICPVRSRKRRPSGPGSEMSGAGPEGPVRARGRFRGFCVGLGLASFPGRIFCTRGRVSGFGRAAAGCALGRGRPGHWRAICWRRGG